MELKGAQARQPVGRDNVCHIMSDPGLAESSNSAFESAALFDL